MKKPTNTVREYIKNLYYAQFVPGMTLSPELESRADSLADAILTVIADALPKKYPYTAGGEGLQGYQQGYNSCRLEVLKLLGK